MRDDSVYLGGSTRDCLSLGLEKAPEFIEHRLTKAA
jgi:hypothetical protein